MPSFLICWPFYCISDFLNWNINNDISLIKKQYQLDLFIVLRVYVCNNMPMLMVSGYYVTVCIYLSPYHRPLTWVHFYQLMNRINVSHWFCSLLMELTGLYSIIYPLTGLLTHITEHMSIEVKAAAVGSAPAASLQGQLLNFSEPSSGTDKGDSKCNQISRENTITDPTSAVRLNMIWKLKWQKQWDCLFIQKRIFRCTIGSFCFLF